MKYTLILAISHQGIVHQKILSKNCNTKEYTQFINELPDMTGKTLIMDNVAFHHSKQVADAMKAKHTSALFIPPYSPKTNAIENVFGVLKNKYRSKCPMTPGHNFDYTALFQTVLSEYKNFNFSNFFNRVLNFIRVTLESGCVDFVGHDT